MIEITTQNNPMNDYADVNILQQFTQDLIDKIQKQKESIINSRLNDYDAEFDYDAEKQRRFKRLVCEMRQDGTEAWYYNNSTLEGHKLVIFKKPHVDFDNHKINIFLEYYF